MQVRGDLEERKQVYQKVHQKKINPYAGMTWEERVKDKNLEKKFRFYTKGDETDRTEDDAGTLN